jgi:hypothetical protein
MTDAPKYFQVADFDKQDHYKNRRPIWVKVYNCLLENQDFCALTPLLRYVLIGLMLLASRCNNRILFDLKYLAHTLHLDEQPDLSPLFNAGFLLAIRKQSASKLSTTRYQKASVPLRSELDLDSSPLSDSKKNLQEGQSGVTPELLATRWNQIPGVKPVTYDGKVHLTIRKTCLTRISEYPSIAWWEAYFARIAQAPWLTGQVPGKDGQSSFVATFDWMLGPKNMGKILSGTYDSHDTAPAVLPQFKCAWKRDGQCLEYVTKEGGHCPGHRDRLAKEYAAKTGNGFTHVGDALKTIGGHS